jgi:hypothetical protein
VDIDIFVAFRQEPGQIFINPQPLIEYLAARGGVTEAEYVVVDGWPIQFLPPTSPMVEEAMAAAGNVDVEGTPARVFTAEHLAAIALETGRAKDKVRLLQFIETGAIRADVFQDLVSRHGLDRQWLEFQRTFLKGAP